MFIEVAINIPADRTFTYAAPAEWRGEIAVGKRVLVPFGKRSLTGTIVGIRRSPDRQDTKEIVRVLDRETLFHEEDLRFYRWAAEYYFTPLGRALGEILPGGIDIESLLWAVKLGDSHDPRPLERDILEALGRRPAGMALRSLEKEMGRKTLLAELKRLEGRGFVRLEERIRKPAVRGKTEKVVSRTEAAEGQLRLSGRQRKALETLEARGGTARVADVTDIDGALSVFRALEKKGLVAVRDRETLRSPEPAAAIGRTDAPPTLTPEQQTALEAILRGISSGSYYPCLLHGVTGSGKTEVYIHAIAEAVRRGGRVLYLVPEIALTPQLVGRLESRFPAGQIAILHSGIGPALRYDQWRRIARGEAKIVVGARSAVFAPVTDLRLLVVDEEHDTSYKQDERMPYNARDLAVVRAQQQGAVVVLGSATPGLQSCYNPREKEFVYLALTRRGEQRELPRVEIVDMKGERDPNGKVRPLSRLLVEQIGRTLEAKKQALLFLNRRGFNTYHYCDFSIKAPPACPECGGGRILSYGLGTERLAAEVQGLFPQARVGRMDSDTTSARGSHERILSALDRGEIDILVGTQMITKGHDFPDVTLVGVVSADTTLNMPDFRAAERTFQILTQVAGRSGRGEQPGAVVIQTLNPGHYAIQRTREHDFAGFYEDEIALRRDLQYPPFSRMINLIVSGTDKDRVEKGAARLGQKAKKLAAGDDVKARLTVIGPMEAPLAKVRGRYRWQLLVRGKQVRPLHAFVRRLVEGSDIQGCEIRVDVDPVNFM